jgi:hypothetical protein
MSKAGHNLTKKEIYFLGMKDDFIYQKCLHYSDYVSLSPSCRKRQEEMLQNAIAANDENTQALVYSGVPAIEFAMDEYLEKYAFTAKISKAVGVFINIIHNLDLKNKTELELAHNKDERERVSSELKTLREQIANGGEAQELKKKFDGDITVIKQRLDTSFKEHETTINKLTADERENYNNDDISQAKAKEIISATQNNMQLQYEILASDLSWLFEKELKNQAQTYLEEYRKYISGLVKTDGFAFSMTLNLIQVAIPDNADDLLEEFSGTKTVTKIERRHAGNINKAWYKPWTWFDEHYHEWNVEVKTEKRIIKMKELFEKSIEPKFQKFFSMIEGARSDANKNAENLKDFFTKEIEKLDNALKEAIQKEEEDVKSQEAIEQKIEENKVKAKWLDEFIVELNTVLEV